MFTPKNSKSFSNVFTALRDPRIADIESPFGPAIIYGDNPDDTQDFMLEVALDTPLDKPCGISANAKRGFHVVVGSVVKLVSKN